MRIVVVHKGDIGLTTDGLLAVILSVCYEAVPARRTDETIDAEIVVVHPRVEGRGERAECGGTLGFGHAVEELIGSGVVFEDHRGPRGSDLFDFVLRRVSDQHMRAGKETTANHHEATALGDHLRGGHQELLVSPVAGWHAVEKLAEPSLVKAPLNIRVAREGLEVDTSNRVGVVSQELSDLFETPIEAR